MEATDCNKKQQLYCGRVNYTNTMLIKQTSQKQRKKERRS
jgi:hypothetical protein